MGTTGSGKTTLARDLALALGAPHVELDALFWERGWTPAALPEFRARVTEALRGECWVVEGNYSAVQDLTLGGADALVWLDYTIGVVLTRLLRRTFQRTLRREELWNGNRERFWEQFASRESLFVWALRTHWRRRRRYEEIVRSPAYAHLEVVRLRSPAQAEAWLATVGAGRA